MFDTVYHHLKRMPEIPCQFTGCGFKAVNESEQVAIVMFNSHVLIHQGGAPTVPKNSSTPKLPPIPRPEIRQDVSEEDWATFLTEWEHFKRCAEIPDARVSEHLLYCCETSLKRLVVREDADVVSMGEEELKAAIKRLAVIKIAKVFAAPTCSLPSRNMENHSESSTQT